MRDIALISRKIYTAGTNFTRPPVVTVATNLNSAFVIFLFVIFVLLYCWGLLTMYKISQVFSHGHMDHPMSVYCWKTKEKNGFQQELPHCCVRFLYYLDVVVKYRGPNSNDKDNSVVRLTWWDLNWVCWWPSSRSHPCAGRAEALP